MPRHTYWFMLIFIAFAGISGAGAIGMTLREEPPAPDKALYETGMKHLEKDEYQKARQALQSFITKYPDSGLTAPAYFAVGDAWYEEGGTQNLLRAVKQFKDFIIFFPAHPKAPEAGMKIISSYMKLMEIPDRDRKFALNAEKEMNYFLKQYPHSEYVPRIREWLKQVRKILDIPEPTDNPEKPHNPVPAIDPADAGRAI